MNVSDVITLVTAIINGFGKAISLSGRDKLKVDFAIALTHQNQETGLLGTHLECFLTAGHRPVTPTKIGAVTQDGKDLKIKGLEATLGETAVSRQYTDYSCLEHNIKYLYVCDSSGRRYKFKGSRLKELLRQYQILKRDGEIRRPEPMSQIIEKYRV